MCGSCTRPLPARCWLTCAPWSQRSSARRALELLRRWARYVTSNTTTKLINAFVLLTTNLVRQVPMDKLNLLGGSLSIGHPFAATGVRIITTAATRLEQEDGQLAVLAACAAGGNAVAMLIERWHPKVEKSSK